MQRWPLYCKVRRHMRRELESESGRAVDEAAVDERFPAELQDLVRDLALMHCLAIGEKTPARAGPRDPGVSPEGYRELYEIRISRYRPTRPVYVVDERELAHELRERHARHALMVPDPQQDYDFAALADLDVIALPGNAASFGRVLAQIRYALPRRGRLLQTHGTPSERAEQALEFEAREFAPLA